MNEKFCKLEFFTPNSILYKTTHHSNSKYRSNKTKKKSLFIPFLNRYILFEYTIISFISKLYLQKEEKYVEGKCE